MNIKAFGGALKMARSFSQMHRNRPWFYLQLTPTQARQNSTHWEKLLCLFSLFWVQVHVSGTVSYSKAKILISDLDVRDKGISEWALFKVKLQGLINSRNGESLYVFLLTRALFSGVTKIKPQLRTKSSQASSLIDS